MSFDLATLSRTADSHGVVIRVVVAAVSGSAPREPGAAMLIWERGQSGTIGGGALEHLAADRARAMLREGPGRQLDTYPLGPALGQCCGGAVSLLWERFDNSSLPRLDVMEIYARPVKADGPEPLSITRLRARLRSQGTVPLPHLVDGWMVEPVNRPGLPLWIYGAGHVGRALVAVLAPLPDFAITWIDTGAERFPDEVPEGITILPAARPQAAARLAPASAHHLILTYSHALDLEICHALLEAGFATAGLIGSRSKWARFRTRLRALGHDDARIARITCPIGRPDFGKHPQAIAVGVASSLLDMVAQHQTNRELPSDGHNRTGRLAPQG
jgi:xanthine dehydrogenase accessory factor